MKTTEIFPPIPADTARTARAVFGSSNIYIAIGDQANRLFYGLTLSDPAKSDRKPVRLLAELFLITTFQYLEALPDSQTADAVRERRDWKYALHLPITISGFQPVMFCEFRKLLLADSVGQQSLQTLLGRLAEIGAANEETLNQEARQVILRVCLISRLANIREAFSQALQALAIRRPDWLRYHSLPHWYERYSSLKDYQYLGADPDAQERLAGAIGADGYYLLEVVRSCAELQELPEIHTLTQVWQEQYYCEEGKAVWRAASCAGCASSIQFGNDLDPLAKFNGRW